MVWDVEDVSSWSHIIKFVENKQNSVQIDECYIGVILLKWIKQRESYNQVQLS